MTDTVEPEPKPEPEPEPEPVEKSIEDNLVKKENEELSLNVPSKNLMEVGPSTLENQDFAIKNENVDENAPFKARSITLQTVDLPAKSQRSKSDEKAHESDAFDLKASRRDQAEEKSRERGIVMAEFDEDESNMFSKTERGEEITDEDVATQKEGDVYIPANITDEPEETESRSVAEEQAQPPDVPPKVEADLDMFADDGTGWEDDLDFFRGIEPEMSSRGSLIEDFEEAEAIYKKEEEEPDAIDREDYYNQYAQISPELEIEKIKNNILQKTVASYFKRRKMDYVLRETDTRKDALQKYLRKLDALGELLDLDRIERARITLELSDLQTFKDDESEETRHAFTNMQNRLKHIGTGLIFSKTAIEISPTKLEKLLKRQKYETEQMAAMRMDCIRLRNSIAEKEETISSLDKIGGKLTIAYYQQLKVENRTYADKIDERDDELTRLRIAVRSTMQELAHIREKSIALTENCYRKEMTVEDLEFNSLYIRDIVNDVRQERDKYRKSTRKMRDNCGLLIYPTLLTDMEDSIKEYAALVRELEKVEYDYKLKTKQIKAIRHNIETMAVRMQSPSFESFELTANKKEKRRKSVAKETAVNLRTLPNVPVAAMRMPFLD